MTFCNDLQSKFYLVLYKLISTTRKTWPQGNHWVTNCSYALFPLALCNLVLWLLQQMVFKRTVALSQPLWVENACSLDDVSGLSSLTSVMGVIVCDQVLSQSARAQTDSVASHLVNSDLENSAELYSACPSLRWICLWGSNESIQITESSTRLAQAQDIFMAMVVDQCIWDKAQPLPLRMSWHMTVKVLLDRQELVLSHMCAC